jgi:hypothetical protein
MKNQIICYGSLNEGSRPTYPAPQTPTPKPKPKLSKGGLLNDLL